MSHQNNGHVYYEICKGTSRSLKKKILSGEFCINNGDGKNNSLNWTIRTMLSDNLCTFNLEIIRTLIEHGAKIINGNNNNNSLSMTLKYGKIYCTQRRSDDDLNQAEENLINLIQLLINGGGDSNTLSGPLNTFTLAIQTTNLKIINLIITQIEVVPDNTNDTNTLEQNTLSCAVLTKNIEIIKIASKHGAKPCKSNTWKNTFYKAIKTGDLMIVREILMVGGYINCTSLTQSRSFSTIVYGGGQYTNNVNLFEEYKFSTYGSSKDTLEGSINKMNELLDLILCSNSKLTQQEVAYLLKISLGKKFCSKVLDCNALLNATYSLTNEAEQARIQKLKLYLKSVMDGLFEKATNKKCKLHEIEIATPIPLCCIDIIFEYQRDDGIEYINWLKY